MLHDPIIPAAEVDPDVAQAIIDFRPVVARIRDLSARAVKLPEGHRLRIGYEKQIRDDMDLLRIRAERIGGDWTDASLLIAVQADIDMRARRVTHPRNATKRVYDDRVMQAVAREQRAKTALDAATLELESATSARQAAEHAAKHFEARRADR